jgi:hypothetical protein
MKARRLAFDALLVAVSLVAIALFYLLPYLPPYPKAHPPRKQGKVLASVPHFGWQTNKGSVDATVTLTLTNAGAIDLLCTLEWFDWRTTNDFTSLTPYSNGIGSSVFLPKGASRPMNLVAAVSPGSPAQLICYRLFWQEAPSSLRSSQPVLQRLFRFRGSSLWSASANFPDWVPEVGYTFGANLDVGEYFRLVYGLNRETCATEEARETEAYTSAASKSYLAMKLSVPTARKVAMEEAEKALKVATTQRAQGATRREVRKAFWTWLNFRGRQTEHDHATNSSKSISTETNQPPPEVDPTR